MHNYIKECSCSCQKVIIKIQCHVSWDDILVLEYFKTYNCIFNEAIMLIFQLNFSFKTLYCDKKKMEQFIETFYKIKVIYKK